VMIIITVRNSTVPCASLVVATTDSQNPLFRC
jgi:hypothetical protein